MKPLVIYHDHCTDGFGAAYAAWTCLGDQAEYLPMSYTPNFGITELCNQVTIHDRDVYILDFSFSKEVTEFLLHREERMVWLDHHKTSFEMWCPEPTTYYKLQEEKHLIILDNSKSGALLAWEFFHHQPPPQLIRHIDDRDRWQFKMEGSKEFHAVLQSYKPWTFMQWRDVFIRIAMGNPMASFESTSRYTQLRDQGSAILRAQDAAVSSMAKHSRKCHLLGLPGLAVNSCIHQSELGHELANQSGTYGLVYFIADNRVHCSLRSNGDYDVSVMAKHFGGGGHKNAAGFEFSVPDLWNCLQ